MHRKRFLVLLIVAIFLLSGCAAKQQKPETLELFAMDTYMTLSVYGKNAKEALKAAESEILRLDALLSTEHEDAEIYALNLNGSAVLSEEAAFLLEKSMQACKMTDGAFNPMVYPLMKAWGFPDKEYRIPTEEEIEEILSYTDFMAVSYDPESRQLSFPKEGMQIDFGGIAKGYTSSRVCDVLKEYETDSAIISLGGNVQAFGVKPDSSLWNVAIRDPGDDASFLGILRITDCAVITSGGYERYFEQDGIRYHHILDPQSGYPADHGMQSVTIVSTDAALADALSTALYVAGPLKAQQIWRAYPELFDCIYLTDDKELFITEGLKEKFVSETYEVHILSK